MKKSAFLELNEYLLICGLNQNEIDLLLARFLEEEARNYIKAVDSIMDSKENTVLH